MPKYRVKELSLLGNELFQAGAEVEFAGLPAENLEPLCDEGRAKYQEYLDSNAKRIRLMREQNSESGIGDMDTFVKAIVVAMAAAKAEPEPEPKPEPAPSKNSKPSLV